MHYPRLKRSAPAQPHCPAPGRGGRAAVRSTSAVLLPIVQAKLPPTVQRVPTPAPGLVEESIPDEPEGPVESQPGAPGLADAPDNAPKPVAAVPVNVDPFTVSDQPATGINPDVMATLGSSLSSPPPCGATGPAGFHAPVGRADFFLNGHQFVTADDGAQHIELPTLEQEHVAGQDSLFTIDRLPGNGITGTLHVPSAPATWSTLSMTAQQLILALRDHGFPESTGLTMCDTNAPVGRTMDFEVADGEALVADVTAHERIHEQDIAGLVTSVVGGWTNALVEMQQAGFAVRAPDPAAATPLIYDEIRRRSGGPGDPCEVGEAIERGVVDTSNALHARPGGNIRVQNFRVIWPGCKRVVVDWGTYPGTPTSCGPATPDLGCQPTAPLQVTDYR